MSKSPKLFLGISYIIILFLFLYLILSNVEVTRLDDFLYYKEIQMNLEKMIGGNLYLNLIIFFIFCLIWVSLLGFGSPLLITSGVLFGKWIGTFISIISISIGALMLYSIANFFFKEIVSNLLEKKFSKYIHIFKKNEFYYFFLFRLAGGLGIPFALQNILPVILNITKSNYFFASFLGFIPGMFIFVSVGSGLNKFIKETDNFSFINLISNKEIYLPIIIFIIFIIISGIVKKKFFNVTDK